MKNEFYIGWETKAASGTFKFIRRVVLIALVAALSLAALLAISQRTIGVSAFEWGTKKAFSGILRLQPYPQLLVARPGVIGNQAEFSSYLLVAPFKFGLNRESLTQFDGRTVSLQGTLIYRNNQTMIEALPESIMMARDQLPSGTSGNSFPLGNQTLVGEIVDSKCFLGVMNPGQLIPHRACAIRCISGGIPPILLVRNQDGTSTCLMLVSAEGKPLNKEILDLVAEPVQVNGMVLREGNALILRADLKSIKRVGH